MEEEVINRKDRKDHKNKHKKGFSFHGVILYDLCDYSASSSHITRNLIPLLLVQLSYITERRPA